MSTRCQIGFYQQGNDKLLKPDALLYRHGDGYPDTPHGVLADLVPFLKTFQDRRGLDDTEYAAAWTLHHLISIQVEDNKKYAKKKSQVPPYNYKDGINGIGFGICSGFHSDIEYYYAVSPNSLKVYSVQGIKKKKDFTLQQTIDL